MPVLINQLEYHVVDACNLACEYCSHYSNFKGPANIVSVEQATEEWSTWAELVTPKTFHIIGGEPLLNKNILSIIEVSFKIWKGSQIRLYSNGILIDNFPELGDVLAGGSFFLGLHYGDHRDKEIEAKVRSYFKPYNVKVSIVNGSLGWVKTYDIKEGTPQPFNHNNQRASWENCIAAKQRCFVLKNNQLWKCPQIAYADRPNIQWFNSYNTCKPTDNISEWASLEDEECCKNCPAIMIYTPHGAEHMNRRLPII